jgi:hypothetical protein
MSCFEQVQGRKNNKNGSALRNMRGHAFDNSATTFGRRFIV